MALVDTFASRYSDVRLIHTIGALPAEVSAFFRQAHHLIDRDLLSPFAEREALCHRAHDQLARELALMTLEDGRSADERCLRYLSVPYRLYLEGHGTPDEYFKTRVSLVELLFREAEQQASSLQRTNEALAGLLTWRPGSRQSTPSEHSAVIAVTRAIDELNARFRLAGIRLHYHAGHIQLHDHDLAIQEIHEPVWELLRDPKWLNVQIDLKEALDRRDNGERDVALYAMKALESTIKIISDSKELTRGNERGAASYIDNLVSNANGRFIEVWEAELLKALFKHVRNPHGHGPGAAPQPQLTDQQQTWVVDTVMSWVKNLVRRAP